jgi:hypothetical protein
MSVARGAAWLVAPVGLNRDSKALERSNWAVVTADIHSVPCSHADTEIHRFGHWACGWFEIMLIRPGTPAADCAEAWENALSDYPVASDEHYSELESREVYECWSRMSLKDRVYECQRARVSVFAARRDEVPERVYERLAGEL